MQEIDSTENMTQEEVAVLHEPIQDQDQPTLEGLTDTEEIEETDNLQSGDAEIKAHNFKNAIIANKLNVKGDLQIYYASSPKDKDLPFHRVNTESLGSINPQSVAHHRQMLKENHILFVSCPHKATLQLATSELVDDPDFQEYSLFYAFGDFKEENGERVDLFTLRSFLPEQNKQLLIVELGATENTPQFFDSILSEVFRINTLIGTLHTRECYFVYLIHHHSIWQNLKDTQRKQKIEKDELNVLSSIWEVDFLQNHLIQRLQSRENSELGEYEASIQDQLEAGLWGTPYDFYQEISELLSRGRNALIKQVELRQKYLSIPRNERTDFDEFLQKELGKGSFDKIVPTNPLAPYLFFTAINFPDIGLKEFHWIVYTILEVGYDLRKKPSLNEEAQSIPNSSTLKTIWEEFPEYWMEKVYLVVDFISSSSGKIIFEDSSFRRNARRYLEKNLFFFSLKCFEQLAASGIWYHPSASKELIRGFTRLMAQKASEDPHAYGQQIPLKLLEATEAQNSGINITFPETKAERQLIIRNNESYPKVGNHHILVGLLNEMLDIEMLVPEVNRFFRTLMDQRLYEIILKVAPRLVYQLQFPIAFWLRQIIEKADTPLKSNAYKQLLNIATRNQRHIYEVLEEFSILWPKLSKKFARYSVVDEYSLTFLYAYLNEIRVDRFEDLGAWPSNFPLFYLWNKLSQTQIEEQCHLLGDGLFHPGRLNVLRVTDDRYRSEKTIQTLIRNDNDLAALVEEWGLILLGPSSETETSEAIENFHFFISSLIRKDAERLDRLQQAISRRIEYLMRSKSSIDKSYTIQIHLKSIINQILPTRRWNILQRITLHLSSQASLV